MVDTHNIPMIPQLLFITGLGNSDAIVRCIQDVDPAAYSDVFVSSIAMDDAIVEALKGLLSRKKEQDWEGLHLSQCSSTKDSTAVQDLIEFSCSKVSKFSVLFCDFRKMENSWCEALRRGLQSPKCRIKKLMLRVRLTQNLATALFHGLSPAQGRRGVPRSQWTKVPQALDDDVDDEGAENEETAMARQKKPTISEAVDGKLKELVLPISDTSLSSIILLAAGLRSCVSLRRLKITRHDLAWTMQDCQIAILMKALRNHPSLKEVSIQGSCCSASSGLQAISECLLQNLERLDLSNHRFGVGRLHGMDNLARGLSTSRTLRFLSLTGHQLLDIEVAALMSAICNGFGQLKELCMSNCNLSNAAVSTVATALVTPQLEHLRRLWLHENPFDGIGAEALFKAVQEHWQLGLLTLPHGGDDTISMWENKIEYYLALNRVGRRLLRFDGINPAVPISLWAVILNRANKQEVVGGEDHRSFVQGSSRKSPTSRLHADMIFYLLQGPVLLER